MEANAHGVAHRDRKSTFPMVSMQEATDLVLEHAKPLPARMVALKSSLGCWLSSEISASTPHPPFMASIKDGYAVRFADGKGRRKVVAVSCAEQQPSGQCEVKSGECARISTGAPVPSGADSVVQVEDTELIEHDQQTGEELCIEIKIAPGKVGQDIRPIGCDIARGETLLRPGARVGPAEIGLMSMIGLAECQVYGSPVVGVASTGNELLDPVAGSSLARGQIYDSNRPMLLSMISAHVQQSASAIDLGVIKDDPLQLRAALLRAMDVCDVLITSGGVSMGEKDHLKSSLVSLGFKIHFGRINMKPGKPTTFATCDHKQFDGSVRSKLLFALPGNPVSSWVTSHLFVLPAIRALMGSPRPMPGLLKVKIDFTQALDPRPEYYRAILRPCGLDNIPVAQSVAHNQMSSRLPSATGADLLVLLPGRTDTMPEVTKGNVLDAMPVGARWWPM